MDENPLNTSPEMLTWLIQEAMNVLSWLVALVQDCVVQFLICQNVWLRLQVNRSCNT